MAVYEQGYRGYDGPLMPDCSRFLVIPRYAYKSVFASRVFVGFLVLCYLWPLGLGAFIYGLHNLARISPVPITFDPTEQIVIDGDFFLWTVMFPQGIIAGFLLALHIGPALISSDLTNNALPLYLARPINRAEYVIGKISVLAILLSLITWIPALLLFTEQAYYAGWDWLVQNMRLAGALFVGLWIWIFVLSLLSLAISALVRWKVLARAALFGVFIIPGAFGETINVLFGTVWGSLLDIGGLIARVWEGLLGLDFDTTPIPLWAAWASLLTLCGVCLLILRRKLQPYEVVR
ncbi:MAG: ABC transporter permease subunit [Acidobacteriota bacterium]|nr:MAG: ABC transporter permease subunit [Acidobacteriota bacterium]